VDDGPGVCRKADEGAVSRAASGADEMRISGDWSNRRGLFRVIVFDLLMISAAGPSTFRIDSWWRRVAAVLSIVLWRIDLEETGVEK